jgi:basic membrane lipoprotein Med (substrate-binding protein (PBP1-ABC) superfamily)
MVKRVDVATYQAFIDARNGKFDGRLSGSARTRTASPGWTTNNKALVTRR